MVVRVLWMKQHTNPWKCTNSRNMDYTPKLCTNLCTICGMCHIPALYVYTYLYPWSTQKKSLWDLCTEWKSSLYQHSAVWKGFAYAQSDAIKYEDDGNPNFAQNIQAVWLTYMHSVESVCIYLHCVSQSEHWWWLKCSIHSKHSSKIVEIFHLLHHDISARIYPQQRNAHILYLENTHNKLVNWVLPQMTNIFNSETKHRYIRLCNRACLFSFYTIPIEETSQGWD